MLEKFKKLEEKFDASISNYASKNELEFSSKGIYFLVSYYENPDTIFVSELEYYDNISNSAKSLKEIINFFLNELKIKNLVYTLNSNQSNIKKILKKLGFKNQKNMSFINSNTRNKITVMIKN